MKPIKKLSLLAFSAAALSPAAANGQTNATPSSWSLYPIIRTYERIVAFDTEGQGKHLPILWGFDTAWNDYANMLRGVRYVGSDNIGLARVSFQPRAKIATKGVLPSSLEANLSARMANVALIGKKVDIALNLDGGEPTLKNVYGGLDANNNYVGNPSSVAEEYALLIDAATAAVQARGYTVVSVAPFNEPDYFWNGTPLNVFHEINKKLKDKNSYPRFSNIRISGGNTLNCDEALNWYESLKEYLDEGNTHQLAGDFNHYAAFFEAVRADGKYASADELHNVMEAMVGVEYGMQTGIWWGTAEQARGEFCKASFGERLGYAENRTAWSAASVYRAPSGKIQGFMGCSERQARPSTYNFVSRKGDVYIDGTGPRREYAAYVPGDPNGEYMSQQQRNAETVISITNGEDIQPAITGDYAIVNAGSHLVMGGNGGSTNDGTGVVQQSYTNASHQTWRITKVPETQGGDFSYYFIKVAGTNQAMDNNNWNLNEGGNVIVYGASGAAVQQWALEYDGDGYFHIRNKHSALYLEVADNSANRQVIQKERSDRATQKWRFLPVGAQLEFNAPATPSGLSTKSHSASVTVTWNAVSDAQAVTYALLRADKADGKFNTIARGLTSTSFLDNSVECGKKYDYKVICEDASGNRSAASAAVAGSPEGRALIADFLFDSSMESEGENGFSIKSTTTPSYRDGHAEGTHSLYFRSSCVQLPYSIVQNPEFTLSMRVNMSSSLPNTRLFATGIDDNETLYLTPDDGGMTKLVGINGDMSGEIATDKINKGEWVHIAIAYDGATATLYINGENKGSGLAGCVPADRVLTYLGRGNEQTYSMFTGNIGDVKVYNYALNDTEAMNLATNGEAGVEETLADREVTGISYFSTQGISLAAPLETGITIVRTTYSDGSSKTTKIMR